MTDYTTDDTPLDPKQWRILTDQQRYALIDQFFITHYRLFPVFEEFERTAAQAREAETWLPYGLALLGESGVGKTAAVKHWMKTAPVYCDTSLPEEQKAYKYISLSAPTTPKALLAGMLRMLEDPSWNRGTTGNMARRLRCLLKIQAKRLVIFDNIHHFFGPGIDRELYVNVLEQLTLPNDIAVVFIGRLEAAETLLHTHSPLHRSIETVRFLRPFQWDKEHLATIRAFRQLLQMIDQQLPLDPSNLDDEAAAHSIYYATDGNPARIFELIRLAAKKAVRIRAESLTRRLLAEAYDELITSKKRETQKEQVNPFSVPGFQET